MKLISWNIRQGGGQRLGAICTAIAAHEPDVVILGEVRARSIREIGSSLLMQPWPHREHVKIERDTVAVCVLSRVPIAVRDFCPVPSENAPRWLDVDLPSYGFGVGALHIPTDLGQSELKVEGGSQKRFWAALLQAARERVGERFILIGDLNTGRNGVDWVGSKFLCSREFELLTTLGWIDAWRHCHSTGFEPTWTSNHGNGFRIDHAFVSPPLVARLESCRYSHSERLDKISDHSILIVEIASSRDP